ncbi:MAG TPA: glycosyltransferase family 4 protein [Thermoanaerobaculia bacterium]|jgi:glycosyltransferase involved in cell wall biosynthesis|nr:glycosyltransferase family 4 protein [Thermoanaerobaculia bacterium]
MTRLLHTLSQRPGRSGSGIFLGAMVRQAARRGYAQHVVVAGPPGTTAAELPPLLHDEVSPIVFPSDDAPFPLPGNSDVMPYPTTVFSSMTATQIEQYLGASRRVMERARDAFRPDVVHAHHLWLMTSLARDVFAGVPLVITSHNAELRQAIKAPHLVPRVLAGVRDAEKVCVLTPQSVADTIETFGIAPERIAITGAGYSDELFHPPTRPRAEILAELRECYGIELPENEALVTFIGRTSLAKGVPFLLEAASRLRGHVAPFRVVLLGATGSGDHGRAMDELVKAAGPLVIHTGAKAPEAIARVLQVSSVFVLPSLFEGLPLTMLEALASGCPAVVSALPTIASWVPQPWRDLGFIELVPPLATTDADVPVDGDVERFVDDLAAAIARKLAAAPDDASRRMLAAELTPHSWSAVFERYERIYREVTAAALQQVSP